MGEKEDKEKAEKLAAAKKRVAQLQKKKKAGEKSGSTKKVKDATQSSEKEGVEENAESSKAEVETEEANAEGQPDVENHEPADEPDADAAAFEEAIISAKESQQDEASSSAEPSTKSPADEVTSSKRHTRRQPSVSLQSKLRSASFRQGADATSPTEHGEDLPDIYRKQMARIDELEKENKRLANEAKESQSRWQKNEEDLELLREKAAERRNSVDQEQVAKLRSEIENLRRNSRAGTNVSKSGDAENLKKEIDSREATINDMQLEISRLRSQVTALTTEGKNENEQIAALQESLQKSEASHVKLQTELQDVKNSLSRASEKAVADGTERTSREVRTRQLERELEESKSALEASEKRVASLQSKIEAMNKLHREAEQRNGPKLAQSEALSKELQMIKAKLDSVERDNLKLREARKTTMTGEGADETLDELEDEERKKLEKQIRDLESENFDLRRGVWRDKRRELQPNLSLDAGANADDFDEVDLNGSGATTRKSSTLQPSQMQTKHSGFTQVINSGLAAFRTSTTSPDSQLKTRARNDSLLEEFDDDAFDEGAFAAAQREEEMRKMVEHVREVKKGLKKWQGWRLDLVDWRRSGAGQPGFGEVFEA